MTAGSVRRRLRSNRRFARDIWRLTRVYWTSPDAGPGGLLLALCVGLELGTVYGNVLIADAQRRLFDAVEHKQLDEFLGAILLFAGVASVFVLTSTYRIYVRQVLEIRWREGMTAAVLGTWMGPQAYCQREIPGRQTDNPDQRIAEDVRNYVASALGLSLSLLAACATLYSFAGLLWNLSADWPIRIGDRAVHVPGLMMWVAIAYAVVATSLTHFVGRPLVPLNFDRLRVEADFRYGLVRFRDNAEAVALAHGESRERQGALDRFRQIVANWWMLIGAQRNLMLFTTGIGQANGIVPLLISAPAYFAGFISLGRVAQAGVAYAQVSAALAWFVFAYQEIAQWRASIERLSTFREAMDATCEDLARQAGIRHEPSPDGGFHIVDLELALPDGRVLLEHAAGTVRPGERVAVVGPAGSGKTTLFRAIAGIWPFGSGRIQLPAGARPLFVPQQAYLPIGTVRQVISYPGEPDAFPDARIVEVLQLLDLGRLATRLDETDEWEQRLSADEHQRLVLARVLLHEPDWIFLDDATAALDESMERRIYALLAERLPAAAVVSISNRPAVARFHTRAWSLAPGDDGMPALRVA